MNDWMVQRALYAMAIPGLLGALLAVVALLIKRPRVAAFAIPVATLIGLLLVFVQPFHDVSAPGSLAGRVPAQVDGADDDGWFARIGRVEWSAWKWAIPAMATTLLAWPAVLLLPRRWWTTLVVAAIFFGLGFFLFGSPYETKGQPLTYSMLAPLLLGMLAAISFTASCYCPSDDETGGDKSDLAAMSVVGLLAIPVLGLAEFHGATMLFVPAAAATVAATVVAFTLGRKSLDIAAPGLAAGALVVPMLIVPPALVSWFVQSSLTKANALALALPVVAGVLAIVIPRLPRAWAGAAVAATVAGLGLWATLLVADTSPYIATPSWLEPWLGDWSVPPPPDIVTAEIDEQATLDSWTTEWTDDSAE